MDTDADFLDGNLLGSDGHTAPLEGDGIPDENQSHFCLSCDEPLTQLYCGNCGQKNDDYRRSLFKLGIEAIAAFTAIENRIWKTWASLITKPGMVARNFANGERMKWSSPIRVYIFMSILLFGYMDLTDTQFVAMDINVATENGQNTLTFAPLFFEREATIDAINEGKDFALIDSVLQQENFGIDVSFGRVELNDGRVKTEPPPELMDQARDIIDRVESDSGLDMSAARDNLPDAPPTEERTAGSDAEGEGTSEINGELFDNRLVANFLTDFARRPAIVNNTLNVWLPRIVFLMMPLTMLLAAIFIRGRRRRGWRRRRDPEAQPALLYDHAVHAAYVHGVAYLLVFISVVSAQIFDTTMIAKILCLYLLIYLPLSLRRMFERSWVKTIWSSYAVGMIYLFIVMTIMTVIISGGVQDYITLQQSLA